MAQDVEALMSFEEKIAEQIPALSKFTDELILISAAALLHLKIERNDNFGLMSLCFSGKQLEHLKAVKALEKSRDAELVARSMLEGLAQFRWASLDHTRASDWRDFGNIHNFRQIQGNDPEDPALREMYVSRALIFERFFSKDARNKAERGEALPSDPFALDWTRMSVRELFNKAGYTGLYPLYRRFSEWHHWTLGGIARAIEPGSEEFYSYRAESNVSAAQGLAVGFQCLFETCELVVEHFGLPFGDNLSALKKSYGEAHASFFNQTSS